MTIFQVHPFASYCEKPIIAPASRQVQLGRVLSPSFHGSVWCVGRSAAIVSWNGFTSDGVPSASSFRSGGEFMLSMPTLVITWTSNRRTARPRASRASNGPRTELGIRGTPTTSTSRRPHRSGRGRARKDQPDTPRRLQFVDPTDPSKGGNLTLLVGGPVATADSTATQEPQMLDNITVTNRGKVVLQEDPGSQHTSPASGSTTSRAARWRRSPSTTPIASRRSARVPDDRRGIFRSDPRPRSSARLVPARRHGTTGLMPSSSRGAARGTAHPTGKSSSS